MRINDDDDEELEEEKNTEKNNRTKSIFIPDYNSGHYY